MGLGRQPLVDGTQSSSAPKDLPPCLIRVSGRRNVCRGAWGWDLERRQWDWLCQCLVMLMAERFLAFFLSGH